MTKYAFHDIARSERYFTATLLSHLLMANNFEGLQLLFNHLKIEPSDLTNKDFEIVSELDPVRDGGIVDPLIKATFKQEGRVAVPDIFLKWGEQILVIEAKFFSLPAEEDLEEQVGEQQRAIGLVVDKTKYDPSKINHCLLLIDTTGVVKATKTLLLKWEDIIQLFDSSSGFQSDDCKYSIKVIEESIIRAENELKKSSKTKVTWDEIKTITEIINRLSSLLESGFRFIGFSEGLDNQNLTAEYFEKRSCYRVSKIKWTYNWVEIEKVIAKYVSFKYPGN